MAHNIIRYFRGKYYFLSNFFECDVEYNGIKYKHTEGAFQAQKTFDESLKLEIAKLSASESKKACGRYGLKLKDGTLIKVDLRPDWEEVKDQIMYEIVKAKFEQNPELKAMLLATGDAELIEGNTWHDNYWGDCSCPKCTSIVGRNQLGKILMCVRSEFKNKEDK